MDVTQLVENAPGGRSFFAGLLKGMDAPARGYFNDPQRVVENSRVSRGDRVLEVGCGSGYFTPALSEAVGPEGLVDATDLQPMSVESTQAKVACLGLRNVNVSQADAYQTGFEAESFDVVAVFGVLPAPFLSEQRIAEEASRVLKPGGVLAIWTAMPFWSPRALLKTGGFVRSEKRGGVYRLHKA
jgi:demethylmenaquinone methyltransferase/2-methoxy-6-polyprenyl-1,4-benzoquinol methylase